MEKEQFDESLVHILNWLKKKKSIERESFANIQFLKISVVDKL